MPPESERPPPSARHAEPASSGTGNALLSSLSAELLQHIEKSAEPVTLTAGDRLLEPEDEIRYVWFPHTALVALMAHTAGGGTAGVAMVGQDGVVAVEALLGCHDAISHAEVLLSGRALRLPVQLARSLFDGETEFRRLTSLYAAALQAEAMHAAACHAFHPVAERIARTLLSILDRSPSHTILPVTHEHLAGIVSAQRTTVTHVAYALQQERLIDYRRGRISVLDRERLEERACECYALIKRLRLSLVHGRRAGNAR